MSSQRRGVGIFGGTFDPLHVGHLVAARWVQERCDLDEVWLMVANDPWQKTSQRTVSSAHLRFEAVSAAVDGLKGLKASELEISLGGQSSSARTLEELRRLHPGTEFCLIVGTDVARGLETWRNWEQIAETTPIVIVSRAGESPVELSKAWTFTEIEIPGIEISSTVLRQRLRSQQSVDFLIPATALDSYSRSGLYSGE